MNSVPDSSPHDVTFRGVRIRYHEAGSGPPLVLLHGFLVDHREWGLVVPGLAKHFRVIALDLPGFGESERPREFRYDREGYAETVSGLMAALDIPRAHVAGHSYGGAVALVLAADHAERVDRLVLINTMSYPFDLPLTGKLALTPVLGPLLFKRIYNRAMIHDYFKRSVFAPGFAYDRKAIDGYYDAFNSSEAREAAYRVLPNTTDLEALGPKIGRVRAPTLVLWGELDPMFPIAIGARLARDIPNARFETIPGCGHAPPEEMPEKTVERMTRHLLAEGD